MVKSDKLDMNSVTFAFVGDIMPGGVLHYLDDSISFFTDGLKSALNADFRIGTLECAVGDVESFDPEKMKRKQDIVYARNSDIERLTSLNINVVSIANNHIYDLGINGLINTINLLDKNGILHCGAGVNLEEASKPAVLYFNGKSYAFIGFCDYKEETVGYVPFATETTSGLNPLYPLSYSVAEVKKYKEKYDYVFVIPHWGIEHDWFVTPSVFYAAKELIKAGADGIIGGHTHRIQPLYIYRNKPIVFSLGNFLFPDRYINTPRPTYYPDKKEDRTQYPITFGYPYVNQPTYKCWRKLGRIGKILKVEVLNDSIKSSEVITELSTDNILGLASESTIKQILLPSRCSKLLLQIPLPYKLTYIVTRIAIRIKKLSNKLRGC